LDLEETRLDIKVQTSVVIYGQ